MLRDEAAGSQGAPKTERGPDTTRRCSDIPSICSLPNHKVTLKESEAHSALTVIVTTNKTETELLNKCQAGRETCLCPDANNIYLDLYIHRVCRFKLKVMRYGKERKNNLLLSDQTKNKN